MAERTAEPASHDPGSKRGPLARDRACTPDGWLLAFSLSAYLLIAIATGYANYRTVKLNAGDADLGWMLLWQGLTYLIWIPVGGWIWRVFVKDGASPKALRRFARIGLLIIPLHVVLMMGFDAHVAFPGTIDLRSMLAQRAQIDLLMYASFAIFALASHFRHAAAEARAASVQLREALASAEAARERAGDGASTPRPLVVSMGARRQLIDPTDVEWFGSAANYVVVNWDGREGLIRTSLQALLADLDPVVFARAHRGSVVNLTKVAEAEPLSDGSWRLRMTSGSEILMSRTYRDAILERLGARRERPASTD